MNQKTVKESETEQVQMILPEHLNPAGRLFGGRLLEWIDVVAAVTARRHSGYNVTTASIDNLQFKAGAFLNDTLVLRGRVTHVGTTSMEVRVDTFVEQMNGQRKIINHAYLVMVALSDEKTPVEVPGLLLTTETERMEWEAAERRRLLRKDRRVLGY